MLCQNSVTTHFTLVWSLTESLFTDKIPVVRPSLYWFLNAFWSYKPSQECPTILCLKYFRKSRTQNYKGFQTSSVNWIQMFKKPSCITAMTLLIGRSLIIQNYEWVNFFFFSCCHYRNHSYLREKGLNLPTVLKGHDPSLWSKFS